MFRGARRPEARGLVGRRKGRSRRGCRGWLACSWVVIVVEREAARASVRMAFSWAVPGRCEVSGGVEAFAADMMMVVLMAEA